MDAATEAFKIKVHLSDIEQPFSLLVHHNTNEEKIFRDATKMINAYYNQYKAKIKGLDTTSYYGMVALLMARLYIEASEEKKELAAQIGDLEKEIVTFLEEYRK